MRYDIESLWVILKLERLTVLQAILTERLINGYKYFKDKSEIDDSRVGIYLFIEDFKIVYIGSTGVDLKSRISKHIKYEGEQIVFFEMIKFKEVVIRRIEKALILLYVPRKNNMSYLDGKKTR